MPDREEQFQIFDDVEETSPTSIVDAVLSSTTYSSTEHFDSSEIPVETSFPDTIVRHNISDEELDVLTSSQSNEAMWAFVGITTGALIPAVNTVYKAFYASPPVPITGIGLLQIGLFVLGASVAVALKISNWKKVEPATRKAQEIRDRTRKS